MSSDIMDGLESVGRGGTATWRKTKQGNSYIVLSSQSFLRRRVNLITGCSDGRQNLNQDTRTVARPCTCGPHASLGMKYMRHK